MSRCHRTGVHKRRWSCRRHPKKGKEWIAKKYFKKIKSRKWVFACDTIGRKGENKVLELYNIASTPIVRHIKVKGNASPDNPEQKEYWENRQIKQGKSYWEKNSRNYKIAQNQNWKCPACGVSLFNGEKIETHHIVAVVEGGLDDLTNLQHLHIACHKQLHSKSKFKGSK